MALNLIRRNDSPTNARRLGRMTGWSRRFVYAVLGELRAAGRIHRTRYGFIDSERRGMHPDECLCRRCLTPRHELTRKEIDKNGKKRPDTPAAGTGETSAGS